MAEGDGWLSEPEVIGDLLVEIEERLGGGANQSPEAQAIRRLAYRVKLFMDSQGRANGEFHSRTLGSIPVGGGPALFYRDGMPD